MAGEDLDLGDDGGTNDTTKSAKGKKKPLSKGQKIGVGIGVATIILIIYQVKKSQSATSASTTTTPTSTIDPATGYPYGSAADQQALGGASGYSGSGGYSGYGSGLSSTPSSFLSGTDPATGVSWATEVSQNAQGYNQMGSNYSSLSTQLSTLTSEVQGLGTNNPPPPGGAIVPPPPSGATVTRPKVAQAIRTTQANRAKFLKAGNTHAAANLQHRLTTLHAIPGG